MALFDYIKSFTKRLDTISQYSTKNNEVDWARSFETNGKYCSICLEESSGQFLEGFVPPMLLNDPIVKWSKSQIIVSVF